MTYFYPQIGMGSVAVCSGERNFDHKAIVRTLRQSSPYVGEMVYTINLGRERNL